MDDKYFMSLALEEAKKAYELDEVPIGCVIVKGNEVISTGYNQKETTNKTTSHAEIIAIEKANDILKNWRLIDCTIYVTLFPCPMCASAINQSRIKKIVYGTIPDYANKELIYNILNDNGYGNSVQIEGNILDKECSEILRNFFEKKR